MSRAGRWLSLILGSALALVGALVPPARLLSALGASNTELGVALRQGAVLFKLGLVVLGFCIVAMRSVGGSPRPHGRREPSSVDGAGWAWAVLSATLVACALLCFHRLDDGLWFDEIVTYIRYVHLPFGQILSNYDEENQHILFSLLAHAACVLFGDGTWALRLPAVLFGVASVWALFLVGRLVGSRREALLASTLMAFSYQLVWFSQNARGYTGLLFLTLLSSWFFVRALREGRPHLWLLYAVCIALGMYIHMTMLFVFVGHFLQYVVACFTQRHTAWPQRWTALLCGFGFGALLAFQLYALVLPQVFSTFGRAKALNGTWMQPWWPVLELARGLQRSLSGSAVALVAILVFAVGLVRLARTDGTLVQLLLLPTLICAVAKLVLQHPVWPRSFFFAFGFMVLVVIRGATLLGQALAPRLRLRSGGAEILATVFSVALILASARSIPFAYGPKQDFAGALAFVNAHKQPGDALVTVGLTAFPYRVLYRADAQEVRSLGALNAVRASAPRTWLLYTLRAQLADAHPDVMEAIDRDFVIAKQFPGTLGGGTVVVCRSDRAAPDS